ncbi:hypothetical protein FRB90_012290 [Tulasnella sp. 427]|nr:hypothetical protein FRB90_012290 [Tulasnella sp. 427]
MSEQARPKDSDSLEFWRQRLATFRINRSQLTYANQGKIIASGGFGNVRKATLCRFTQLDAGASRYNTPAVAVAVKALQAHGDIDVDRLERRFIREAYIWSQLKHDNILEFLGFHFSHSEGEVDALLVCPWFEHGQSISYIKRHSLPTVGRLRLILDAAEGLHYLHSRDPPICHGDIKGANFLINDNGRGALCDFGSAHELDEMFQDIVSKSTQRCTIRWTSPERLDVDGPPTQHSDVWSWGWLAWEIITEKVPFDLVNNVSAVIYHIMTLKLPRCDNEPTLATLPVMSRLIRSCWESEPNTRPSIFKCIVELKSILGTVPDKSASVCSPPVLKSLDHLNPLVDPGILYHRSPMAARSPQAPEPTRIRPPEIENAADQASLTLNHRKRKAIHSGDAPASDGGSIDTFTEPLGATPASAPPVELPFTEYQHVTTALPPRKRARVERSRDRPPPLDLVALQYQALSPALSSSIRRVERSTPTLRSARSVSRSAPPIDEPIGSVPRGHFPSPVIPVPPDDNALPGFSLKRFSLGSMSSGRTSRRGDSNPPSQPESFKQARSSEPSRKEVPRALGEGEGISDVTERDSGSRNQISALEDYGKSSELTRTSYDTVGYGQPMYETHGPVPPRSYSASAATTSPFGLRSRRQLLLDFSERGGTGSSHEHSRSGVLNGPLPSGPGEELPLQARPSNGRRSWHPTRPLEIDGLFFETEIQFLDHLPGQTGDTTRQGKVLRTPQQLVAIKSLPSIISEARENNMRIRHDFREWHRRMLGMQNPRIATSLGVVFLGREVPAILTPWYSSGNIADFLKSHPGVERKPLLSQLVDGLAYLHGLPTPIIHSNLKPSNILIDNAGSVKLVDVGVLNFLETSSPPDRLQGKLGNARWTAPEVLEGHARDKSSDVYSLGCVALLILNDQLPYGSESSDVSVMKAIARGGNPINESQDSALHPVWRSCWVRDTSLRPRTEDLNLSVEAW